MKSLLHLLLLAGSGVSHASELRSWLEEEPLAAQYPAIRDEEPPLCTPDLMEQPTLLPDLPHLYMRWDPVRSWGTPYAVEAVMAAAEQVQLERPQADPMIIGDLSLQSGGMLSGHRNHREGLDADISLYFGDGQQEPFMDVPPSKLDVATTWTLIEALLDTGRVDYILLDPGLISRIRDWLRAHKTLTPEELSAVFPAEGSPRAWESTGIVRGAANHRNHLHVHFLCREALP